MSWARAHPCGPFRELRTFRLEDISPCEETCLSTARAVISALEYVEERGIRLLIRHDLRRDAGARNLAVYGRLREIVRRHPPPPGVRMRADMVRARRDSLGNRTFFVDELDLSSDAPEVVDGFDWGDDAGDPKTRRAASEGISVFAIVGDEPREIAICAGSDEDVGVIIDYPRFFAELYRGDWASAPNRGSMTDEFLLERSKSIMAAARVVELAAEIAEGAADAIPEGPFDCLHNIRDYNLRYDERDTRAKFFDSRILRTFYHDYSLAKTLEKYGFADAK